MEARHVHHDYYASLPDFDSRLKVSILGRLELDIEFPNIAERFAPYLGWLDHPEVMKIHFEDLVNDRAATLNRIIDHFLARVPLTTPRKRFSIRLSRPSTQANLRPSVQANRRMEKRFTSEHKKIFKDVAGDLLIRLGYEKDNNW